MHLQKLLTFFFSKNTCEVDIVLTRTVNILTSNELVANDTLNNWAVFFKKEHLVWSCVYPVLKNVTDISVDGKASNYYDLW